ncbi:hypothetical protein ACFO1B_08025 [Dactylosporangium siamense]|uniref:Uncharacterized protein n=1 Tax=Dactylosporangium siamense TaxID=685454 RepID=A0A919PRL6_9ACTN|nr:hypothetical protein [Dactylosporangium siamense]GIG48066.1 hypothetical protein Dsi01nite_061070 [Dactylosporangium siamense]
MLDSAQAFMQAAEHALERVPDATCDLGDGRRISVREFLHDLAAAAADWPHTPPELCYADVMQHCFWTLLHGRPEPVPGELVDADDVAFGVIVAMTSADRGGHHAAADLCETALAYMETLPAWQDVDLTIDRPDGGPPQFTLTL